MGGGEDGMVELEVRQMGESGLIASVQEAITLALDRGVPWANLMEGVVAGALAGGVTQETWMAAVTKVALEIGPSKDEGLAALLNCALKNGITANEVGTAIVNGLVNTRSLRAKASNFPPSVDPVFTEVPEGCIDVPSAARKYNLKINTLRQWINNGHLTRVGRLKAPASGGGYLLTYESEIQAHMNAPRPKGGRPRKEVSTTLTR